MKIKIVFPVTIPSPIRMTLWCVLYVVRPIIGNVIKNWGAVRWNIYITIILTGRKQISPIQRKEIPMLSRRAGRTYAARAVRQSISPTLYFVQNADIL